MGLVFLLASCEDGADMPAKPGKHRTERWKQEVSWDLRSSREFLPAARTRCFNEAAVEKGFAGAFPPAWTALLRAHAAAETWTWVSHIPRQMSQWFNYWDGISPSAARPLSRQTNSQKHTEAGSAALRSGNSVGMWEIDVQLPTYLN